VRAGAFPISINTGAFKALAESPAVQRRVEWLRQRVGDQAWLLGVDRLDYTKGLPERFQAFEAVLEKEANLRGRISLMQIAAPSREMIDEYQEIQAELESLVGRINGTHGTVDWTPIRYLNKYYNHAQLAALYRLCRVGLVTPLCDGMNLVAKEYIAAQDPEDPGVLVLSRFAGAADELTDAVLVNPHDISETAEAIRTAIEMPLAERRSRWERMMQKLETNDVHRWRRNFLVALEAASGGNRKADTTSPQAA
jgi:trehalose 6-phosphate synthase